MSRRVVSWSSSSFRVSPKASAILLKRYLNIASLVYDSESILLLNYRWLDFMQWASFGSKSISNNAKDIIINRKLFYFRK